ncbi:FAD-dependent oxidoreductase [Solwaraspora sp. WMMA2080]|uniref:oxidoreductase n=1 Tax=unclassified Solwaraspora TaxID=2627926 RepID=UPI00248BA13B|nr:MULTISPECIES: FAD-dependent oxidoreductase [unclassified Solwaraspora]WBB95531.1 FAD-dependent oxidoreductase [Solwaraspora sp. WMMA2059]WBC20564.1 FAD-dependent oxidoreductase [Solwaraspora sp. WMMA2080]
MDSAEAATLLADPYRLGPVTLRSRIVKAPTSTGAADTGGYARPWHRDHYARVGRGSALTIVEFTAIDDGAALGFPGHLSIASDDHAAALAPVAERIRADGRVAGLQIAHAGRQRTLPGEALAASAVPWPAIERRLGLRPRAITVDEIAAVVDGFGRAAGRAAQAGFQVVEIQASNGYLLAGFLSPHTNRRDDDYGGDPARRRRVLLEVVARCRAALPAEVALTVRLSDRDHEPGGQDLAETTGLVSALAATGQVDAVHVSSGNHATRVRQVPPAAVPPGAAWRSARTLRAAGLPTIACGGITEPAQAAGLLRDGTADLVALGRAFLADPDWAEKALAGAAKRIRPCVRGNDGCHARAALIGRPVACTVNPSLSLPPASASSGPVRPANRSPHLVPSDAPVLVAGAGPAGLEAAHRLTEHGHRVRLYTGGRPGGALRDAVDSGVHDSFAPYLRWLTDRLAASAVEVVDAPLHPADLGGEWAGLLVATGGVARSLSGAVPALDVLRGLVPLPADGPVLVIGAGRTGTSTAAALARRGADVTLLGDTTQVLDDEPPDDPPTWTDLLASVGARTVLGHRARVTNDQEVQVDGTVLRAGLIVAAVGREPHHDLYEAAAEVAAGRPVLRCGDALRPGRLHDAVHAGARAARTMHEALAFRQVTR